jgi:hypothetical protein
MQLKFHLSKLSKEPDVCTELALLYSSSPCNINRPAYPSAARSCATKDIETAEWQLHICIKQPRSLLIIVLQEHRCFEANDLFSIPGCGKVIDKEKNSLAVWIYPPRSDEEFGDEGITSVNTLGNFLVFAMFQELCAKNKTTCMYGTEKPIIIPPSRNSIPTKLPADGGNDTCSLLTNTSLSQFYPYDNSRKIRPPRGWNYDRFCM